MKLRIDIATCTVTADNRRGPITLDQYHLLGDEHRFIVRRVNRETLIIEIKLGRRTVQQGTVKFLSNRAGTQANGQRVRQRYTVELDPSQPIYPMGATVDVLLARGIHWLEISPMFSEELVHHVGTDVAPVMLSDGTVRCDKLPETIRDGELFAAVDRFTVTGATWAVLGTKYSTPQVFIWQGSESNIYDITGAIDEVKGLKSA